MSNKSIKRKKGSFFGLNFDQVAKYFFLANAFVAVVVLGLLTFFLCHEGAGFFPQYWRSLVLYRKSGKEYVSYIKAAMDDHAALSRYLQDLRGREMKALEKTKSADETKAALAGFDKFKAEFDSATDDMD